MIPTSVLGYPQKDLVVLRIHPHS